jgi:hypothetical protein
MNSYNTNKSNLDLVKDLYEVDIDFDEASRAWRENKKIIKNGMFSYMKTKKNCCHIQDNGKKCKKKRIIDSEYCELHYE